MNAPFRVLLIAALCAGASACATAPAKPTAAALKMPPAPARQLTPQEEKQLQMRILTGELAAGRGQPDVAAREFLEALKLADDAELAQRTTSLALSARDETLALAAAQRWQELEPNEADPREVILRLSLNRNDNTEAYKQAEAIVEGNAGGIEDGFGQIALILSQTAPEQSAPVIALTQQLAARWPKKAAGPHAVGLVALRFNELAIADEAAQQALKLAPGSRDEELLLAGVRVRQGRVDESDAIIDTLAKRDKNASELRLGYAKLLLESGAREPARVQLLKVADSDAKNQDARYALGVLAFNDRNLDEAERWFRPLVAGGERAADAAFQMGRIAEQRKRYDDALSYYARVGNGPQALDAQVRRAAVLALAGRLDEARTLMADLREQFPQVEDRLLQAEAEMLSDANRLGDALALYDNALKADPANADLLYGRSLVHERQKRIDLAEQDLREILKSNADDSRALNALGYMLVVHKPSRLKEARKLIERANELQPGDAAIMDSLGWVQFKQGDRAAAREQLQQAYNKFPDAEIAAHLGEVLWSLGDKVGARKVWQQALENDPGHSALQETMQRLDR